MKMFSAQHSSFHQPATFLSLRWFAAKDAKYPRVPIALSLQGRHSQASVAAITDSFVADPLVASYAPCLLIEPTHLERDITLAFTLQKRLIKAQVKQTFRNKTGSIDQRITLNACGLLDLECICADNIIQFHYTGEKIELVWKTPFVESVVEFKYAVQDPVGGFYFSVPSSLHPERVLHCITDHEPERCRYWLPCVDYPAIRTTIDFHLTADSSMMALANGYLVEDSQSETQDVHSTKTTHWKLEQRCPSYLICIAVGHFEQVIDTSINGIPIHYYAPLGNRKDDLLRSFDQTPCMMEWITKKFDCALPWPKYYQIASPMIRGAMENISLVTWNELFILDKVNAIERKSIVDSVNIHEMAHSFFGDSVVIRHFEHVWLKEGWATYVESLWLEDNASMDDFRYEMIENANAYIEETNTYMRPIVTRIFDTSWTLFDNHTYPGGAWRIHMLRKLVGDGPFFQGVQTYLKAFAGKTVETDDFRKCLEESSGHNLTLFFDQWFYSKGFPKLKGTFKFDLATATCKLDLEQTQVNKEKSIPVFSFKIQVEIIDTNDRTYKSHAQFDRNIMSSLTIQLDSDTKPKIIRIDPDAQVLFTLDLNPGEDILGNTAKNAADITNRIWAYSELTKLATGTALKLIEESIGNEKYRGVREQVALALAKVKHPKAQMILCTMLQEETHPLTKMKILKSMSGMTPIHIETSEEYTKIPNIICGGYRSLAIAFENTGNNPLALPYLISCYSNIQLKGQYSIVCIGILNGIAKSKSLEAFEFIINQITSYVNERVLCSLLESVGKMHKWQGISRKDDAEQCVAHYLCHETTAVRKCAFLSLCEMKPINRVSEMKGTKGMYPEQDWVMLSRKLTKMQVAAGNETQELLKKLVEMETRFDKLECEFKMLNKA